MKLTRAVFSLGLTLLLSLSTATAQTSADKVFEILEGNWQGAFIKNNSFQKLDLQFYKEGDQIKSLQIIEEWHPQFGEFVLPVEIDSIGKITFNTGHGKAIMELDNKSLELFGSIESSLPSIYVHLKKVPLSPVPDHEISEVEITNDSITLFGHLHKPRLASKTAIIIVGGRSCYAGSTRYNLYAKLLRSYGVTVLVYNKRGTGKSTGDCTLATIDDLASDLVASKNYLAGLNTFEHIGVLGSSAGGWVMTKAEEKTDFDFMISVVGPSTSVRDQQMQSMNYGFDFYKLPEPARKDITEYTEMMFDAKANQKNYDRFVELLEKGKKDGWDQLLDDTDIPANTAAIDSLWVRRHNFDPGNVLSKFDHPFLAIYGEIDWIVPYRENVDRLENLFSGDRKENLNVVIAHDAEHGTETKGKYISLKKDTSYWRFFRISPSVQIGIIDFLKKYSLIQTAD